MFLEPLRFLLGFPHVIPNTTLLMLAALHPLASEKILLGIQQLVIAAGKAAGFLRTAIFYLTTSKNEWNSNSIFYALYTPERFYFGLPETNIAPEHECLED